MHGYWIKSPIRSHLVTQAATSVNTLAFWASNQWYLLLLPHKSSVFSSSTTSSFSKELSCIPVKFSNFILHCCDTISLTKYQYQDAQTPAKVLTSGFVVVPVTDDVSGTT